MGLSTSASYFTVTFSIGLKVVWRPCWPWVSFVFAPDFSVNAGFRGESVDIFNPRVPGVPDIDNMLGTNSVYGFSAGLIHDTRDSPFYLQKAISPRLNLNK